ncbi:MAG: hypothetical protein DRP09_19790 [Candidatus Thorarchaeota archaeon]|nr:MAG: hypothetical protein DRP09_19790 [Candidatus Thorarchaeota archaeon]
MDTISYNLARSGKVSPAAHYRAIVYKDDSTVWAEDSEGKTIAYGVAGEEDAAVIQSALDSLTEGRTWKETVVLRGSFTCEGGLLVPSYTKISNEGVLKLKGGVNEPLIRNKNYSKEAHNADSEIEIIGGTLDGNKSEQGASPADVVKFVGVAGLRILNATLTEAYDQCIDLSYCADVQIVNCRLNNGRENALRISSGCYDVQVANCIISSVSEDGILTGLGANKITISNTLINSVGEHGIACAGSDILVSNCRVEDASENGMRIANAMRVTLNNIMINDTDEDGIALLSASYVVIGDSLLYSVGNEVGKSGIYADYDSVYITVQNCYIKSIYGPAIKVNDTQYFKLSHCYLSPPTDQYAILESGTSDYNTFVENYFLDGAGASITGTNTKIRRNRGVNALTENAGTATFSGDGSTTQFSIAHGLVSAPTKVQVTPLTEDAAGDFYVTADNTNIYINYLSAPASGADNVKVSWSAEV